MKKWKKLKTETVLDDRYMKIRRDHIEFPNGQKTTWIYWDARDSAMVVGLTRDKKLVMVEQYRYLPDKVMTEVPSGGINPDETEIAECAKREFEEESGYKITGELVPLGAFYETCAQLTRKIHIFLAKEITMSEQKLDDNADGREDLRVKLVDFNKAVEMVLNNKIDSTPSALAILLAKEKLIIAER